MIVMPGGDEEFKHIEGKEAIGQRAIQASQRHHSSFGLVIAVSVKVVSEERKKQEIN